MGKPLLTDEIIERANRGELLERAMAGLDEATKVIITGSEGLLGGFDDGDMLQIQVAPSVYKSRRIEHQRRDEFEAKLNWVLAGVFCLIFLLVLAIFRF